MVSSGFFCLLANYCIYGLFNDTLSILDYTASIAGRSANDELGWTSKAAGTEGKTKRARICNAAGEIQTGHLLKCR
jgi:hypothetical protein